MNINQELKMGLEGHYKVAIVDANGNEIWRQPKWEKNLILNQGMDALAGTYLADVMKYAVAGTGSLPTGGGGTTRVNSITSSYSSASVIEGGLQLDVQPGGIQNFNTEIWGGWSGSLAAGDIIQFADGTEVKVGSVSATTAGVTPTNTVATQSFTIWKTSQTGMQGEVKRGGSGIAGSAYLTGVGNCGSSTVLNRVVYLRTYDFATETTPKIYSEVGVAWTSTVGANTVFSRIVLPQTVSIDTSQRLRLVYQLGVTFTPTSSQYVNGAIVTGWPVAPSNNTNMTQSIQQMWVSSIDTNGNSGTSYASLEPPAVSSNCAFFGSSNSQSLVTFGTTPINRSTFGAADIAYSTADSYVLGSYQQYKNATFELAQLNYQNLRSFGFGPHAPSSYYAYRETAFVMLFEQSQSKYNTQTLTMTYKWNWSRVLV